MNRMLCVRLLLAVFATGTVPTLALAQEPFVVLDPLMPTSINDLGHMAGTYFDNIGNTGRHGFLLANGTVVTIDSPPSPPCPGPTRGPRFTFSGVNNSDQVVGDFNPCSSEGHGFVWSEGTFTIVDVPGVPNTSLRGINDLGDIVGGSTTDLLGFVLSQGMLTMLVPPGDPREAVSPFGINNRGDIVGIIINTAGFSDGFLLANGQYTRFRVPGSRLTNANGINDQGDIVGTWMDENLQTHGFIIANDAFREITFPAATFVSISGINNSGIVVGQFTDAMGEHGFQMGTSALVAGSCTPQINNDGVAVSVTATSFDPTPVPNGTAGTFFIDAAVTNTGPRLLHGPVKLVVGQLTGNNLLVSATEGDGSAGSKQMVALSTPPLTSPAQSVLSQGGTVQVRLAVGLSTTEPFELFVDLEACAP